MQFLSIVLPQWFIKPNCLDNFLWQNTHALWCRCQYISCWQTSSQARFGRCKSYLRPVTWWQEAPFLHRHFWRHSSPHLESSDADVGQIKVFSLTIMMIIQIMMMTIMMIIQMMMMTMTFRQDTVCHSRRLASQECKNTVPTVLSSASGSWS